MTQGLHTQKKIMDFIFYTTPSGKLKIEVYFHEKNIWMNQGKMADLFGVDRTVITKHLGNVFETEELDESSVSAKFALTADDGKIYQTKFYNLDAIIAIGYRINSKQATQFRIWATNILKEYLIKGFAMDDERLKNGKHFDEDYFDELLERIREIRASERRFYQKITDIYATSSDYDKNSEITKDFFSIVQNKLHYAISGHTAAEIVYLRADSEKKYMGLTTWKQGPQGKILKSDISIAKNYLNEDEIQNLNLLVNAYLDIAEIYARNREIMTMKDRKERLDEFLKFSRKDILEGAGRITAELAKEKAEKEFELFRPKQDSNYLSDFDDFVHIITKN